MLNDNLKLAPFLLTKFGGGVICNCSLIKEGDVCMNEAGITKNKCNTAYIAYSKNLT